jgi:hypothetical protein
MKMHGCATLPYLAHYDPDKPTQRFYCDASKVSDAAVLMQQAAQLLASRKLSPASARHDIGDRRYWLSFTLSEYGVAIHGWIGVHIGS